MFISGMVLWQTEGSHALIGLWVLGMLVFIPGFYFTCASTSTHCLAVQFASLLLRFCFCSHVDCSLLLLACFLLLLYLLASFYACFLTAGASRTWFGKGDGDTLGTTCLTCQPWPSTTEQPAWCV